MKSLKYKKPISKRRKRYIKKKVVKEDHDNRIIEKIHYIKKKVVKEDYDNRVIEELIN